MASACQDVVSLLGFVCKRRLFAVVDVCVFWAKSARFTGSFWQNMVTSFHF